MSFDISFDFRFDSNGFFADDAARQALERAAEIWEGLIGDEFDDVRAGTTFSVRNPTTGGRETVTLTEDIDDLLIFAGALPIPGNTLATAGPDGFDAQGDVFSNRISPDFRGTGPVTDFEPWSGTIAFDLEANWNFALDGPRAGMSDFLSVALHEIGHILGIGTSGAFANLVAPGGFGGVNARAENGGQPLPLEADLAHVVDGFANDAVLMDPIVIQGTRVLPSDIDLAMLADIGFEIAGFAAQGNTPELTTPGDDVPVFGTILGDLIDGLAGNDQIVGQEGDDTVLGSGGADSVFGSAGNDRLDGGDDDDFVSGDDGDDTLTGGAGQDVLTGNAGRDVFEIAAGDGANTINDFDLANEILLLRQSGFATPAEAIAAIAKPFSNVSRLTFSDGTSVDVFHDSQSGTPLEARHVQLNDAASRLVDQVIGGTEGADTLSGGDGNDTITAGAGRDSLDGGAGDDLVQGEGGFDTLDGAAGNDTLEGNFGNDSLHGGDGNDELQGGLGFDTLRGDAGDDLLVGRDGFDTLEGGAGNDTAQGNAGNDILSGGADDDLLVGGIGSDVMAGDAGDDLLQGQGGFDTLSGGDGADTLQGNNSDDVLSGGDGNDRLEGGFANDLLNGDAGDDLLLAGNGTDTLLGGAGADRLEGNAGSDRLDGGLGDDVLRGGIGADVFVFRASSGNDRVADLGIVDAVELDAALLGGTPVNDDLRDIAALNGDGFLVLDFGDGDTLAFSGITDINQIIGDVSFV